MRTIMIFFLFLLSANAFAVDVCHFRYNPRLAITVTIDNRFSNFMRGGFMWDDKNVCSGEFCTQEYAGTHRVIFNDLIPPTPERVRVLNVGRISVTDDLGNRFNPNSLFGNFIRTARFVGELVSTPNLIVRWNGTSFHMNCRRARP